MLFALLYGACSLRVQYALLFVNALTWRIFHSFGLGFALRAQSDRRWIVRHFVKHYYYRDEGSAVDEAFAYWKATYNFSLTMTYGESHLSSSQAISLMARSKSPLLHWLGSAMISRPTGAPRSFDFFSVA